MAKLKYWESNRNMLLFLVTFNTLHNNVTNFSNEWKQEVKCAESSITIFSNKWKWGWNMLLITVMRSLLLKVVLFLTADSESTWSLYTYLMLVSHAVHITTVSALQVVPCCSVFCNLPNYINYKIICNLVMPMLCLGFDRESFPMWTYHGGLCPGAFS